MGQRVGTGGGRPWGKMLGGLLLGSVGAAWFVSRRLEQPLEDRTRTRLRPRGKQS